MFKARQKELDQYKISRRHSAVMHCIQAIGKEATTAEISRWLFREPHSVSELLNRMEQKGLVRKIKDLGKKNLVRLMLTEKGRQAYHQSSRRESIYRILSCLSEEERQQLKSCLLKLRNKAAEELQRKSP